MLNFIYGIIYNPKINKIIRAINYGLAPILPHKIKIHPSGTVVVKIKNHNSIKFKTNQTNLLTKILFWEGYETFEYTTIFLKLIKKVDVFFDIGSNIGYYTLMGANANKNLKIEAFEPSLGVHFYLSENVKINDFSNQVSINYLALSDTTGEIDFHEIRNKKFPTVHNLSGEHNLGTKNHLISRKTTVKSDTLDNFVAKKQTQKIDLIKIDTEGSEHLILENSKKTIAKFKPIIICEVLFNTIETQLEEIMIAEGYEFYNHKGNGLQYTKTLKRTQDNGVRNCFFVHPSKKHLINEFLID